MRVLLAENDLHTGQSLFCVLRDAEYTVDWVRDGRAASLAIAASYYAVVLLNLSLPGIGGIALLKASRAAGNKVPWCSLAHTMIPKRMRAVSIPALTIVYSNHSCPVSYLPAFARFCGERLAMRPRESATNFLVSISRGAPFF